MSAGFMKNIAVFYDEEFPFSGERPDSAAIAELQEKYRVVGTEQLSEVLTDEGIDAFIHLHGPYFPKNAWISILAFLRKGKGLVSLGGVPFRSPVYREDSKRWVVETEQTAYHQQLQIQEALAVDPAPITRLAHHPDIPLFEGKENLFTIEPTFGLVLHVTRANDMPSENGSSGPMDARIYPLLKGISGGTALEREVAAPAVLLENTKGEFAGGRWVFVNQLLRSVFWANGGVEALGEWANYTAQGVTELWLKPNYASYMPGERAIWTIQLQRLGPKRDESSEWSFSLSVGKSERAAGSSTVIWKTEFRITAGRELGLHRYVMPQTIESGLYLAEYRAVSASGEQRMLRQGIWGLDQKLLREGELLTCDRDYFWKNSRPLPIVGMTYMTSDVARKFLQLPNVAVWDRDMAQMKKAGINLIRTGVWTAWRQLMFIDGHPSEEVLRSIDAFLLTAKRHDLEVTFNFFAFTPEAWEGVNPYLDPRSVEAQKRFIAAIVTRHAESTHVHWDLINEPSLFDPKRIFGGPRSCQDRYEREAFAEWLTRRHKSIRALQERWNMTPEELPSFQAARLPEPNTINFNPTESSSKKGGPWLDYALFTMDMHNRWAAQLTDTIRSIAPKQLVTVGQDEGLGAQRPSPFFYADVVDYTTVHSWWKNDDLVWDSVFAKAPDKPCLV